MLGCGESALLATEVAGASQDFTLRCMRQAMAKRALLPRILMLSNMCRSAGNSPGRRNRPKVLRERQLPCSTLKLKRPGVSFNQVVDLINSSTSSS